MEWISVKDKTPPHGFIGFVFTGRQVLQSVIYDELKNEWYHPLTGKINITHWMALPAPPEVKKKMISGSVSFNFSVDEKYLPILDKLSSQKITNLEVINSISRFLNLDGEFELSTNYFHVKLLSPED